MNYQNTLFTGYQTVQSTGSLESTITSVHLKISNKVTRRNNHEWCTCISLLLLTSGSETGSRDTLSVLPLGVWFTASLSFVLGVRPLDWLFLSISSSGCELVTVSLLGLSLPPAASEGESLWPLLSCETLLQQSESQLSVQNLVSKSPGAVPTRGTLFLSLNGAVSNNPGALCTRNMVDTELSSCVGVICGPCVTSSSVRASPGYDDCCRNCEYAGMGDCVALSHGVQNPLEPTMNFTFGVAFRDSPPSSSKGAAGLSIPDVVIVSTESVAAGRFRFMSPSSTKGLAVRSVTSIMGLIVASGDSTNGLMVTMGGFMIPATCCASIASHQGVLGPEPW